MKRKLDLVLRGILAAAVIWSMLAFIPVGKINLPSIVIPSVTLPSFIVPSINVTDWITSLFPQTITADSVDLYWVGGTASWDNTAGTKWATSSGGAGGHTVPLSTNKVIFDGGSGAAIVTVSSTAPTCADLVFTGTGDFAGTFGVGTGTVNVYGSLTMVAGMTLSGSTTFDMKSTAVGKTVTTATKTPFALTFSGAGGGWTLQDTTTLISTGVVTHTAGTLDTNSQAVNCYDYTNSGATARTLTTGTSTITCHHAWSVSGSNYTMTNLSGTAIILDTSTTSTFAGSSLSYGTVTVTGYSVGAAIAFTGTNVYGTLSITPTAGTTVSFANSFTVSGTLTITGIDALTNRVNIISSLYGTQRTITAATVAITNTSIQDMIGAGAGNWNISAGNTVNKGNNTNITFTTSELFTVYWVGNGGNWSDPTHWSLTSGGGGGAAFPTSIDNALFDSHSFTLASQTIILNVDANCANFDWTGVTNTPRLYMPASTASRTINAYGNFRFVTGMNFDYDNFDGSPAGRIYIAIKSTSTDVTFTTAGRTIYSVTFSTSPGVKCTLQDTVTCDGGTVTHSSGTLDTNGQSISGITSFSCTGSTVRILTLGSSTITMIRMHDWTVSGTNVSVSMATSTIIAQVMSDTYVFQNPPTNDTFAGGGYTYGTVSLTTSQCTYGGIPSISGTNTFTNLTILNANFVGLSLSIQSDQVITGALTMTGYNSSTKRLTVKSNTTTGRQLTVNGSFSITNCNLAYLYAIGPLTPWNISAGINSDFGGNINIIFTPALTNYWVGNTGSFSDITHWASTSGGTGGTGRIPIKQDSIVVDANSVNLPGRTITVDVADFTGFMWTNVYSPGSPLTPTTISLSNDVSIYGNFLFNFTPTVPTLAGSKNFIMKGGTVYTTMGSNFANPYPINIDAGSNVVQLSTNLVTSNTITLLSGILDLNGLNLTCAAYDSSTTTGVRGLLLSTGTMTLNSDSATNWWNVAATNYSQVAGTSTVIFTRTTVTAGTFAGASQPFYNVQVKGTGNYPLTISGSNSFNILTVDRSSAAKTVKFSNGTTTTVGLLSIPVSGTIRVVLTNTSTNGIWTISQSVGQISTDYIDIQYSVSTGGAVFYAGAHSTIQDGTLSSSGGIVAGSPVPLYEGSTNTPNVTTVGTLTALLGSSGLTGTATSGAAVLVTGSPKALTVGSTTVTTTGTAPGIISITVTGSGWTLTSPAVPTTSTIAATFITLTTATLNGNLGAMGGYSGVYVYFHYGTDPTLVVYTSTTKVQLFAPGAFNSSIAALISDTLYYSQAVASDGAADLTTGTILPFTTLGAPIATTNTAATITISSATLQGVVTSLGIYTPVYAFFQWDTTGTYASPNITPEQAMTTAVAYNQPIAGLVAGTTYHFRAALRYNGASYVYGSDTTFVATTLTSPVVITSSATSITLASVTLQGSLTSTGGYSSVSVYFEYGLTAGYGTTTPLQSVTSTGTFTQSVTGLISNTGYHYRAKVAYGSGLVVNGGDVAFTTIGNGNPGTNNPDILSIVDAKVVTGYLTPGDQMYIISYKCIYLNGAPSLPASEFFVVQLLNNNAIVGQWPLPDWGYQPDGLYLAPASTLPFGGAYTIKIVGIPSKWGAAPSTTRTLNAGDWYGTDLTQLDNWVISTAKSIGQFYNVDLLTYTTMGTVLNSVGGALFNNNISGLAQVRPHLFSAYASRPTPTNVPGTSTQFTDMWNTSTRLGPYINALLQSSAISLNMDQVTFNNLIGVGIWLFVTVLLLFAFKGSFMAPLISAPILMGVSWVGLLIPQVIVILAVLDVTLLVYALLPRGTG